MGFNPQDGDTNIHYRARVGHGVVGQWDDYKEYEPDASVTWLEDILDLSEDEKIDFGVKIGQWLFGAGTNPTGSIVMSYKEANFRQCP